MATPTTNASVTTNPGGTGTTITPTLPTHAAGDIIEIFVVNTGVTAWSAPAGWTTKQQQASSGNASTGVIGTLLYRRVLSGDTLPLASPVCSLGATVTRSAVAQTKRGADLESVHVAQEWLAFGSTSGTSNPVRPPSVTTRSPENLVHIYYGSRSATTAPEQTNYTQVQQVIISGTIVNNVSERNVADQNTVLSNQDASPTSGARWIAMISCTPSPDYPYYRSGSQAFNASATSVTPALPTGTTASDNRSNKDLIIATVECAGTPTIAPNTPADWIALPDWSNTTSGGGTTVRKYAALYDGSLDRQFNRSTTGEIFVYFSTYHNAHQTIPTGTSATQQNASSTTSTFPALVRTGTKATVQATCVADATPTFTAPVGWTERNDSQGVTCADQSFNATGTTASASFTLNSASPTLCGLLEVFSVSSVINLIVTPASVTLTVTAFAPQLKLVVTPAAASLALTTFAPTVTAGVPFPSTDELDNFNRANGDLGSNWGGQVFSGDANFTIDGNKIRGTGGGTGANQIWDDDSVGPDLEVWVQIVTEADRSFQAFFRLTSPGGSIDGYSIRVSGSTDNVAVFLWEGGSLTGGLANWSQTISDGDWFGARVIGDTITVYYKDVSVADEWFQIGEVVDDTHAGAGYLALYTFDQDSAMDSFGGGTLVAEGTVVPDAASLVLAALAVQLREVLTAGTSSLTLTTFAPVLRIAVTPATTSLSLATFAPALHTSVIPGAVSLTLATFAAQLRESLTPMTTTLTLTTFAPSVTVAVTVAPATTALSLTTFAVSLRTAVTPASTLLALTTFAPTLREVTTPGTAALTLTAFAPTVNISADRTVVPATATLTLQSFASVLVIAVTPAAQSLTLIAFAPSLKTVTTPVTATLSLTSFSPVLAEHTTPAATTLNLTTFAPDVVAGGDVAVTPGTAALTVTSFAPSLKLAATPAAGSLVLTTFAPALTISGDKTVIPASATLVLTTFAPAVTLPAIIPHPRRTYVVESGRYAVDVVAGSYEYTIGAFDYETEYELV